MYSKFLITLVSYICILIIVNAERIKRDSDVSFCDVNDATCNTASISFQIPTDSFDEDFIQLHKNSFECHIDSYKVTKIKPHPFKKSFQFKTFKIQKFKEYQNTDTELEGFTGKWINNEQTLTQKASSIVLNEDHNVLNVICELPFSDVYNSLHPELSRSSHNNPLAYSGVSISSFIVKLVANGSTDNADNYVSIKYFVLYDGKCRTCTQNMNRIKRSKPLLSVECKIKENTCENNGLCYLNGEVSHNMLDLDGKPVLNAFVCASNISQRGLYMPCAKENGGCKYEQICNFNATTLEVSCN